MSEWGNRQAILSSATTRLPEVDTIDETVFMLGAGFNADAIAEAGPIYGNSIYDGKYEIDCGYPLVSETARLCFGLDALPPGKSIEDLFQDALQDGDYSPMEKLADRLMEADYRLATKLASSDGENCYREFFHAFGGSHFLTFNYDSLPEIFLFKGERWYPHDGYGVPVQARLPPWQTQFAGRRSASLVLHLHGSLCLYTSEFELQGDPRKTLAMLVPREQPQYVFDADSVSSLFSPFERMLPGTGYETIERRVIAPVPNKANGLKEAFINRMYAKASSLVRATRRLIAVGYSFGSHDRASYAQILSALRPGQFLVVVSPDARRIAKRLAMHFPELTIEPIEHTLKSWSSASFRGARP